MIARYSRPAKQLSADALRLLQSHAWPGNVRELRNLVERACVLVRGMWIEAEDLSALLNPSEAGANIAARLLQLPLREAIATLEREMISHALAESQGNRAEAARRLGIHRQLLYAKLKEYGLE